MTLGPLLACVFSILLLESPTPLHRIGCRTCLPTFIETPTLAISF